MYIDKPKQKKNGEISYRFICSGKDPMTGEHINYTQTWVLPRNLTSKKEIDRAIATESLRFEEECRKKSLGISAKNDNILFNDYADEFLSDILIGNPEAYSYYKKVQDNLKVIKPFFEKVKLQSISIDFIDSFYKYICSREYTTEQVIVKKSLSDIIEKANLSKAQLASNIGLERHSIYNATSVGKNIYKKTAILICRYFNVNFDTYFETKKTKTRYALATNQSVWNTLVMILNKAVRKRKIDYNFACKLFVKPVTGTVKEKNVYEVDEAKAFIKELLVEPDLRIRSALLIFIYLGLRRCEVCGLTWDNIDFENETISINKNRLYLGHEFGVVTKYSPKTKKSARTLRNPKSLFDVLVQYKQWWDEQKLLHGDTWKDANSLFLQDCGKPINPGTMNFWLNKFEVKHGFKHISPHELRHTAITLQKKAGISPKVVSENAGHASEKITDRYTHTYEQDRFDALNRYEEFLLS